LTHFCLPGIANTLITQRVSQPGRIEQNHGSPGFQAAQAPSGIAPGEWLTYQNARHHLLRYHNASYYIAAYEHLR